MVSTGAQRVIRAILLTILSLAWVAGATAGGRDHVLVSGGTLAGQDVGPREPVIHIEAGRPIAGTVKLTGVNATTDPEALVPLGYTWTWGPRQSSFVSVDPDLPPGPYQVEVMIDLDAPSDAGTYYILFGHRRATSLDQVFSSTSHESGTAVWNDGNDYHDLDADDLAFALRFGYAEDWLSLRFDEYEITEIAVAPVQIVVAPPAR